MRHVPRLYSEATLFCGAQICLSSDQAFHICRVLRKKKGDEFVIFNFSQGAFSCTIKDIRDSCTVFVRSFISLPESLKPINVGVPLLKNRRFENILDSATQLGVTQITPIKFEYSQLSSINLSKAKKQIIASTEQSLRCVPPLLNDCKDLANFIKPQSLVLCANERAKTLLDEVSNLFNGLSSLSLIVGPEGGFSGKEQDLLYSSTNVVNVSLGDFVLRSEVAITTLLSQVKIFY